MNASVALTQSQLSDFLLNVAVVRPVFIWGPPYSEAREVPATSVVFRDARAYDAGYMRPDDIAGRVKARGRGGTVLQPGVDLLERAADFPKAGPILIITDGLCDRFQTRREHGILLPEGRALPFAPRGKVFRFRRP